MDLRRMLRDFNRLGPAVSEVDAAAPDDEADGYALATSAQRFSKATREVVDDKLTFSAALLRAGEVAEAKRILAEVEHEVRTEEAALLEHINEVSAKRAVKREHMTRLRLVRMLATAMVGAGLLGISAMGMAVAGMFDERGKGGHGKKGHRPGLLADARNPDGVKKVMIGGVAVKLTKQDLQTFRRLTSGSVDASVLEKFLIADLDLPPAAVDQTLASVLSSTDPVLAEVEETTAAAKDEVVTIVVDAQKRVDKAKDQAAEEPQESEDPSEPGPATPAEPPAEETPSDEETPEPEAEKKGEGGKDDRDGQESALPRVDSL